MANPTGKNQYSKGGGTVAYGGSRRGVSGLSPAKASAVGKNLVDKGWQRASTGAPGISRYSRGAKRILVDRNPFGQRMGGASVTRQFGAPNGMESFYNARQLGPLAMSNPTGKNQYTSGGAFKPGVLAAMGARRKPGSRPPTSPVTARTAPAGFTKIRNTKTGETLNVRTDRFTKSRGKASGAFVAASGGGGESPKPKIDLDAMGFKRVKRPGGSTRKGYTGIKTR